MSAHLQIAGRLDVGPDFAARDEADLTTRAAKSFSDLLHALSSSPRRPHCDNIFIAESCHPMALAVRRLVTQHIQGMAVVFLRRTPFEVFGTVVVPISIFVVNIFAHFGWIKESRRYQAMNIDHLFLTGLVKNDEQISAASRCLQDFASLVVPPSNRLGEYSDISMIRHLVSVGKPLYRPPFHRTPRAYLTFVNIAENA